MTQPPVSGDPYDYVPNNTTNYGSEGVRVAWDFTRQFYGQVLGEAWADLQAIQGGGSGFFA